jgi:general secretion pathway protein D
MHANFFSRGSAPDPGSGPRGAPTPRSGPSRARCARPVSVTVRLRRPVLILAIALAASGCATASALRAGRQAERVEDYDRAVVEYTKALRARPGDRNARLALERSKLRAADAHFARGRALAADSRFEEAAAEYQLASEMNPTSAVIEEALRETRAKLRAKVAVQRAGKTELETLIEQTRLLPPPGLELPAVKLQSSVIFRDASSRDVYTAIARWSDVSVVFDPAFREAHLTIDLRNATLEDALNAVSGATRNFYRVTAPRTVTIIPDTPAKRREYEEEIVRTFYLSNADLKETLDLLRIVIDNRRLAAVSGTNAIAIKDTPERILAAGRIIGAIDKARPEVVIDVELLEVDRTRLQEYGLQIASPGSPGVSGSADVNRSGMTLRSLRSLTQSDVFVSNVPGLFYRLLKTDASTRTLANPQLRTSEGMPAQARFGERVPIPMTTFAPLAAGGVAQQPITSFTYENIGVNIDITPRTHHNDDVSLGLKIEVSNISGTGFGGLPTFGNRSISTTIRLRDGETNMLAGLIRDDERKVLAGVPGLSDLPVVGRLFAHNRKETQETDIILTLTPHIVRVLDLTEADLRPFRVGRDPGAGGVTMVDLPPAIQPPAAEPQPEAPKPPPGASPFPIRPGLPQPPPPKPPGR